MITDFSNSFLDINYYISAPDTSISQKDLSSISEVQDISDNFAKNVGTLIQISLIYDTLQKIKIDEILPKLIREDVISEEKISQMFLASIFANFLLYDKGIFVEEILFSAYTPGEAETEKELWFPYIELKVQLKNVNELVQLWDELLEQIKSILGEDFLEEIDLFLTRS